MNRKEFLAMLGLGLLAPNILKPQNPSTAQGQKIYRNYIKGLQYYDYAKIKKRLKIGAPLQLRRESQNHYDRYAIEVWYDKWKLGYLPLNENKVMAVLMDQGHKLRAQITRLSDEYSQQDSVGVAVYM